MIPIETRINSIDLANVLHYLFEHDIKPTNKSEAVRVAVELAAKLVPDVFKEDEVRAAAYLSNTLKPTKREERMNKAAKELSIESGGVIDKEMENAVKRFRETKYSQ